VVTRREVSTVNVMSQLLFEEVVAVFSGVSVVVLTSGRLGLEEFDIAVVDPPRDTIDTPASSVDVLTEFTGPTSMVLVSIA